MLERLISVGRKAGLMGAMLGAFLPIASCTVYVESSLPNGNDNYQAPRPPSNTGGSTGGSSGGSNGGNTGGNSGGVTTISGDLFPVEDAYGNSCNPSSNYGGDDVINTGEQLFGDGSFCEYTGFVRFDLGNIPKGAEIIQADLVATTSPINNGATGNTVISAVRETDWSANNLTYENMPSTGSYITARNITFDFGEKKEVVFDVKSAVQDWVDGKHENYGFMIRTRGFNDDAETFAGFYGDDWGNSSEGWHLYLKYSY